jgi:hypothetical protein
MQQAKSPALKRQTCFQSVHSAPFDSAQHTPANEITNAAPNGPRRYQRALPKQITKLTKYNERGMTHSNGTAATSRQSLFVVANKSPEAAAGNNTHHSKLSLEAY